MSWTRLIVHKISLTPLPSFQCCFLVKNCFIQISCIRFWMPIGHLRLMGHVIFQSEDNSISTLKQGEFEGESGFQKSQYILWTIVGVTSPLNRNKLRTAKESLGIGCVLGLGLFSVSPLNRDIPPAITPRSNFTIKIYIEIIWAGPCMQRSELPRIWERKLSTYISLHKS
jgi:hypothetical protein